MRLLTTRRPWGLLVCLCLCAASAAGDNIVSVLTREVLNANDSVAWTSLGSDGSTVPTTFSATSTLGKTIGGSLKATGYLCDPDVGGSCNSYPFGDFTIWTRPNGGPLTLTFPAVSGLGTFVENDAEPGTPFTASLDVYNGTTLLGTVTKTSDDNGNPVYLGAIDTTGANITSAVFNLTVAGQLNWHIVSYSYRNYDCTAGHTDPALCTSLPLNVCGNNQENVIRCPQKCVCLANAGVAGSTGPYFSTHIPTYPNWAATTPVFGGTPDTNPSNLADFYIDSVDFVVPVSAATTLSKTAGNNNSATVNTAYSPNLKVTVLDQNNQPFAGAMVTFAALPGGSGASGTFAGYPAQPLTTGADGTATAPQLTANGAPGQFTVQASVANTSLTQTFTLTNLARPTTTTAASATATYSPNDQNVQLSATVSSSPAVNSGTVTFAVSQGGSPVGSSVTSGTVSNGSASANFTLPGGSAAGQYTITATYNPGTGLAGSSDNLHTLTVNKASQTINFPNPGNQLFGSPFSLSATASSGLTVSFASLTPATCSVSGTQANFIASGTCTIQASQAGNSNYSAATPVSQSLTAFANVSSQVSITQNGFGRNRATGIWSATMTVANTGPAPISGPIEVVFGSLPAGVAMTNNTGLHLGVPYLIVANGTLARGASVTVTIQFMDSSNTQINFTPLAYSGAF